MSSGPLWQAEVDNNPDDGGLQERLVGFPAAGAQLPAASSTAHIQVVAPATLPEGYEFEAAVGNTTMKVRVPAGGIEKGQTFSVPLSHDQILRSNAGGSGWGDVSIPVGHWRDGVFDCFRYGPCHPHCWTSCCCPLLAAGQVITRLKLTWTGEPGNTVQASQAFSILFIITVVHFMMIGILYLVVFTLDPNDYSQPEPPEDWAELGPFEIFFINLYTLLKYSYLLVTIFILYRVRQAVRAKYAIPGEALTDCLCSCLCSCLVAGQMLRHTTDYDVYPSQLASQTGLPDSVPLIV